MSRHRLAPLVAVALGAGVAALAAQAGPPGSWTRVTDPNGRNIDQVGLARTGNGVLHVFWKRRLAPTMDALRHTPITPAGKVGGSSQVLAPLRVIDYPDAVVLPDGRLRVFFSGIGNGPSGVMAATGTAAGTAWKSEGAVSESRTAGSVGAAVTSGGDTIFALTSSFSVAVHLGLDAGEPDTQLRPDNQCCDYHADLATDAKTGQSWVAYSSLAKSRVGTWAQQVLPAVGKRVLVPGSVTKGNAVLIDQRVAITARLGAPGVYVASCSGYPTCKTARLWKIGGKAMTVGASPDVEDITASPGPEGRIWVAWHDGRTNEVLAARTNKAATRVGPVVKVKPPAGTRSLWKLAGEGSLGPLDLLLSATTGSTLSTWHTQVLPPLSITVKKGKPAATILVTDAADRVQGAKVRIAGKTLTTTAAGVVKAPLPSVKVTIKATKAGYAPATVKASG